LTAISVSPLKSWQRRLVITAWITYAAYYLGRVNLSTALPAMEADLAFSKGQLGLLTTGYFWSYALGQLINGQLGDRLSPRRFVLFGMLGSAAVNLVFGTLSTFPIMFLLWTVNGYFQATGWGPILRTLANWLTPGQRRKVSGSFGSSFVAGNTLTWLFTGWLVANFGWRTAFWVPAVLLAIFALAWFVLVRDTPGEAGYAEELEPAAVESVKLPGARELLRGLLSDLRRIWSLNLSAAFLGFCLISLIVWLPTHYVEVGNLDIGRAAALSSLAPFAGIIGTLTIGWFFGRFLLNLETRGLTVLLLLLAGLFLIYSASPFHLVISSAMLMLIGAVTYGASSLTLTTMPLILGRRQEASGMAGLIDFSFNIGGGLSGAVVGTILDTRVWDAVFVALAVAALLAAVFLVVTIARLRV
jgi:OPA family glycerol-3-phosphate transporter-like MFS transporter